jgi:hypothetical protein
MKLNTITFLMTAFLLPQIVWAKDDRPPLQPRGKIEIKSEAGLNIPEYGIAVDALYDPRLDDLVEGYKIISILLTNRGTSNIGLNVRQDKWVIIDSAGRKHVAENHVSHFDRGTWEEMEPSLKQKLDYPQYVKGSHSTTIDVFFPKSIELLNFKEIIWKSASIGKEFNIYTNMENIVTGETLDDKNFQLPSAKPVMTHWDREDDEKTRDEILNPKTDPTPKETVPTDGSLEPALTGTDPRDIFDPGLDDLIIIR